MYSGSENFSTNLALVWASNDYNVLLDGLNYCWVRELMQQSRGVCEHIRRQGDDRRHSGPRGGLDSHVYSLLSLNAKDCLAPAAAHWQRHQSADACTKPGRANRERPVLKSAK